MNKIIIGLMLSMVLVGCTSKDSATRVLESRGYTDIKITGYSVFGCSNDDTIRTGFEATSRNGKHISGVVCSGLLKGNTIRLD